MNFSRSIYQNFSWRLGYYVSFFLLNICIAQYFHAAASGWFNYMISICSLVLLIAGFSLDAAIGYHIAKGTCDTKAISGFILTWALVVGLIAAPVSYFIYSSGHFTEADMPLLWGSWLYIGGFLLISMLQSLFYAQHNYRLPGLVTVAGNIVLILLLLTGFYFKERMDIALFFRVYAVCFFIQGLLFWGILLWKDKLRFFGGFDRAAIARLFGYASLVFMGNLVFFLVYRIDYWFVNKYCTEELLGNYIQVSKIVQVFLVIPASMASVIFPAVAGGKMEMLGRLKVLSRVMVSSFSIILLLLALTGKWLFVFIFGPGFDEMYEPFLLLVPGIICLTVISLLGAWLGGKNRVRVNLTGAIIALCITVTGDILLIPMLQIKGAAIASSISYAGYLAYLLYWFHKNEEGGVADLFICTKKDIKKMLTLFLKGRNE